MTILDLVGALAFYAPFLAIFVIAIGSGLHRAAQAQANHRKRPANVIRGAVVVMAMALQQLQILYRPSTQHVVKAEQQDEADEDDSVEPDTPTAHLRRQLRRIRRGEPVDRLTVRI